jgi:hypothetical protein
MPTCDWTKRNPLPGWLAADIERMKAEDPHWDEKADVLAASFAFKQRWPTKLTSSQVLDAMQWLVDCGYFVPPSVHEKVCQDYAAKLRHCETAADELVARLRD